MPTSRSWILADRAEIWKEQTWLGDFHRGVVISPDFDGLLSALFLNHRASEVGQHVRIVGAYELRTKPSEAVVYLSPGENRKTACNAIWLDHDISRPHIRSIGQHLVVPPGSEVSRLDLPRQIVQSCNPNVYLADATSEAVVSRLVDKYPFGTIHWLHWLFNHSTKLKTHQYVLLAHADSAGKNLETYRQNAEHWLRCLGPGAGLDGDTILADLQKGDTSFALRVEKWLVGQGLTGGNKSKGQTLPPVADADGVRGINALAVSVCETMNWAPPPTFAAMRRAHTFARPRTTPPSDAAKFAAVVTSRAHGQRVFSYAITDGATFNKAVF